MATSDEQWTKLVRGLLKAELKRREITYEALAEKLNKIGIEETPSAILNKISRGRFTAVFMLQCLTAIGCNTVRISEVDL